MKKAIGLCLVLPFVSLLGCAVESEDSIQAQEEPLFNEANYTKPLAPGKNSVLYSAETVIAAPIDVVWKALIDLPAYEKWNPFVLKAEGSVTPGGSVKVVVSMNGLRQNFDHYVMIVDKNQTFCWRDAGWNTRFVFAQRCRWLSVRPDGKVQFRQTLQLDHNPDGINLVGVASLVNGPALRAGIDNETRALKAYAENQKH